MRDLRALKLFTRVARLGSFSAAAREANMSQPQVSRAVADLEADLRAVLLTRTSRAVVLTEAGASYLARVEPILLALDEAGDELSNENGYKGLLRLSMPTSIGTRAVIPALAGFARLHPDLGIDIQLDDHWQDLIRAAVDVAFRVGRLPESSATSRQIGLIRRVVVASPAYLAEAGTPTDPQSLRHHRIVGGPATAVPTAWRFQRGDDDHAIDLSPHFTTNDNVGSVAAATAGYGITSTTEWACERELADGRLVEVLGDWSLARIPIHAYFPMGRDTRGVARAAVKHVERYLAEQRQPIDAASA